MADIRNVDPESDVVEFAAEQPRFVGQSRLSVLPACCGTRYKSRVMEPLSTLPVSSVDIDAAARVLAPFAVRTPLLSSPALDERAGTRGFLKPEMLQRTGSFNFRGAFTN